MAMTDLLSQGFFFFFFFFFTEHVLYILHHARHYKGYGKTMIHSSSSQAPVAFSQVGRQKYTQESRNYKQQ